MKGEMMADNQEKSGGWQRLTDILSEAAANGADAVELERDSGGSLEVAFMSGNTGGGFMLSRDDGWQLIESIYAATRKSRGNFRVSLHGKDYLVQVKTHDHFGEDAFRLTWREAKR
jgi:hypothetical protein